ncbi:MAG: alpha-glucosidase [Anaerolineales bacterium]
MKRRLTLILVAFFALLLVAAGWLYLPNLYARRQITGPLTSALPDADYTVGDFLLQWREEGGGTLEVRHRSDPGRILWATLPGKGFVAAAEGEAAIEEERGSFFIEDDLDTVCTRQTLESITEEGEGVQLEGILRCGGGEAVGYALTFTQPRPNHLAFRLTLADPRYNRTYLTYASHRDERFFGFGEQFSYFDLKGRRLPLFVMEQGIGRGAQPITLGANLQARAGGAWHTSYAGVPHYVTSDLRSLFLETYAYSVFDLRRADRVHVQLFEPELEGRILYGESPAALIGEYTEVAGRMRPLPDWILEGAVVGMQGGTDRVREVFEQLQAHDVPLAGFWLQDWVGQRETSFGKQLWWNWELDQERYPEWEALVADLAAEDVRVLTYASPFLTDVSVKPNARRNLFAEAAEQGFLVQTAEGEPYLIQNTDFAAGLVDLTNPEAWAWMRSVLEEEVIGAGASGWMADFGEALPNDARLHSGEPADLVHNRYPELWAELNREVVDVAVGGESLVFFNRSGYRRSPGSVTLFWLGDQLVSWDRHDGIKTAVTGLLSGGISGYSLNHSDIGGYTTITNPIADYHRSRELLMRWMELNAFTTVYRTHEGNQPEQNHQIYSDEEALAHFARFAKVYEAWAFYRKELVIEAAETGLPVVRHPFIHYPDDPHVYGLSYQEFLVGTELLVAPVLDPETEEVEVYLPGGRWVHLWSGQRYEVETEGLWVTVPAPLGEPGVFYREGSAVGERFVANLREAGILE